WMALRPVWSGALLVLVGGLAGVQLVPWLEHNSGNTGQALNVRARQPLTPDQLSNMVVSGLTVSPSPGSDSPTVRLQLSAEQPMVLTGRADEPNVRQVLTYMVENSERFDAGVRVEAVNLLVGSLDNRPADADAAPETPEAAPAPAPGEDASFEHVVRVLQELQRRDPNPYVRLRSAAALRQIGPREMQ